MFNVHIIKETQIIDKKTQKISCIGRYTILRYSCSQKNLKNKQT